jgi:hypothetical protein
MFNNRQKYPIERFYLYLIFLTYAIKIHLKTIHKQLYFMLNIKLLKKCYCFYIKIIRFLFVFLKYYLLSLLHKIKKDNL